MVLSLMKEKNAAVIDTMSYLECMDHRIPGSQCIALEELDKKLPASFPNKSQSVIFYCESDRCPRAGMAYEKAKLLGYENIYVLEDGLVAWKRAGHEVETLQRMKKNACSLYQIIKVGGLFERKKRPFRSGHSLRRCIQSKSRRQRQEYPLLRASQKAE